MHWTCFMTIHDVMKKCGRALVFVTVPPKLYFPTQNNQMQSISWLTFNIVTLPSSIAVTVNLPWKLNWRAQWKNGITGFGNPKRSKVNEAFSLSSKLSMLKFNSWNGVLLKFSLIFLDYKNSSLTFDLLRSSKTLVPFFHWALQFVWCCKLVTTNQLNNRCKLSCRFTGFKCPPLSILHMCANYVKDMQRLKPTSSQVPRHVSIVWKHFGFEMDDSRKLFTGSGTICKLCRQKVAHDESATN